MLRVVLLGLLLASAILPQIINPSGGGGPASTIKSGTSLPSTCTAAANNVFLLTSPSPAALYWCSQANTWTTASGGSVATGNLTEATSSVLTIAGGAGAVVGSGTTIQVKQAGASSSGYVSSADWNKFNSAPQWSKYTVPYTALTANATTQQVTLFNLPAKGKIQGVTIKHSAAFTKSGLTAMTVSVGSSGTPAGYAPAFDVFQSVSNTAQYDDGGNFSLTAAAHDVIAQFTSTGTNLGNGTTTTLTAGSVDIWVLWSVLP